MIMISREEQRVFFLIEKCASTSIREALLVAGWERVQSTYARDFILPQDWTAHYVTRHPVERVLSYWKYRARVNDEQRSFSYFVQEATDMPLSITKVLGHHVDKACRIEFILLADVWPLFMKGIPLLGRLNVSPPEQGVKEIYMGDQKKILELFADDVENFYPDKSYR